MVNIRVNDNTNRITINVPQTNNTVTTNSVPLNQNVSSTIGNETFYNGLAKEWAISPNLVQGIDYSAKYYAQQAKQSENIATEAVSNIGTAVEDAQEYAQTAQEAADYVVNNAPTATVTQTETGAIITTTDLTHGTTTATLLNGAKGDTGATGATGNGISEIQIVGYSQDMLTTYYSMNFTDGTHYDYSITDGRNGTNGTNGTNGVDGYSPTATVTQTGAGATITITDKNGTTTANITNGLDGFDGIDGRSATITGATASVTNTVGTPSVTVTSGGTEYARSFNFAFSNLKGDKGDKGDTGEVTTEQLQSALSTKQDALVAGTDLEIIKGSSTHNLPEGYTEVEYIQADGDTGIITSVAGNINTNVTLIANCTRTTTASQVIISDGYDGNGGTYFGQPSTKNTWGASANGGQITSLNVLIKTEFNISSTITNTFALDGTVAQGSTVQTFSRLGTVPVSGNYTNWSLFGSINKSSNTIAYPTYGRIYYAKFEQNNTVVAEYIPAIRNSDYAVGLYDIINDTFIARNLGTGTLIAGEKVAETATINFINETGYITGIDSSDVTTALGYTPYNSSNPSGYTSNVGTVTSVNNVQPVNGNVTLSIPSAVTESTVSGWGFTKNTGTVTSVNNVQPVNGNVTISIPDVSNFVTNSSLATALGDYVKTSVNNTTQGTTATIGYVRGFAPAMQLTYGNYQMLCGCAEGAMLSMIDTTTNIQTAISAIPSGIMIVQGQQQALLSLSNNNLLVNGSELANNTLSNLGTTASTNFDGQWVPINNQLANNITWNNKVSEATYDISSYLPDDNYNYEVMIAGQTTASAAQQKFCTIQLKSDIQTSNLYVTSSRTTTTSTINVQNNASIIIPVGPDRYITQYASTSSNASGVYSLWIKGYRRIGTNA